MPEQHPTMPRSLVDGENIFLVVVIVLMLSCLSRVSSQQMHQETNTVTDLKPPRAPLKWSNPAPKLSINSAQLRALHQQQVFQVGFKILIAPAPVQVVLVQVAQICEQEMNLVSELDVSALDDAAFTDYQRQLSGLIARKLEVIARFQAQLSGSMALPS